MTMTKHRLILPMQAKGNVGKSIETAARACWLNQRGIHWQGFDLDGDNKTLSRLFPTQAKLVPLNGQPDDLDELISILRKATAAPVTLVDPRAHLDEQLMRALLAVFLFVAVSAQGALPGFRAQSLGATAGFASSIAVDSRGSIYYTTTDGNLFRFVDGQSTVVSHLNTIAGGNSGLLGMALRDDRTAVVHYTTPGQTADVISLIDLPTGSETILDSFICDKDMPQRGSSTEHHGGNPTVGADGSIFVGIGDYGSDQLAADPAWNAGKVFRISPDGSAQQFARGFRNPFDLAWDAARQRLIVPDNGVLFDDEINIVHEGDFCGWPFTMGNGPPIAGAR